MMIAIAILAIDPAQSDDVRTVRLCDRRQHPGGPPRRRPVNAIRVATFALSGTAAAMAGTIDASRVLSAQASSGQFLTFTVLTGIIVGGTSILGGEGTIGRTVARLPVRRAHRQRLQPAGPRSVLPAGHPRRHPVAGRRRRRLVATVRVAGECAAPCISSATSTGPSSTSPPCQRDLVGARPAADRRAGRRAPSTRTSRPVALQPGGWLAPHVHSFEEALYVLEGELLFELGRHRPSARGRRLRADADRRSARARQQHAAPCRSGSSRSRRRSGWRRIPAARTRSSSRAQDLAAMDAAAARPPFGDPTLRWVGHYDGTGPQLETLRIKDAARGRASAGRDTALVVYSGISVKMLVDQGFGADHVTMFTVDYEIGGAAQAHDHPFEEAYVFLAGEVEAEFDGQHYVFRPGDIAFAGTGSVHGFYNTGTERVRWIETQAPQPPGSPLLSMGAATGSGTRPRERRRPGDRQARTVAVVVVGGTRAIGLGDRPALRRRRARRWSSAARTRRTSARAVAEHRRRDDRARVRPRRSVLDRAGARRRRAGPPARAGRDRPRPEHRRGLRHRQGDPARDAQARRLHGGRPHAPVAAHRRRVDRAVRRHGQGAAVPGLDDGHDRQRRRGRPDADAGGGAASRCG